MTATDDYRRVSDDVFIDVVHVQLERVGRQARIGVVERSEEMTASRRRFGRCAHGESIMIEGGPMSISMS